VFERGDPRRAPPESQSYNFYDKITSYDTISANAILNNIEG
jgi:hypothetical protein